MKQGEKLVRYCVKERSSGFNTVHDFTVYSNVFSTPKDKPQHIQKLFTHLSQAFIVGAPKREKSCSSKTGVFDIAHDSHDTDLTAYAELSNYMGKGHQQHPIVQDYLHDWDPLTIATEIPVWDDTTAGFIDIIRIHEDFTIEIADFKPKARREKKAHLQVWNYKDLLVRMLNIDPDTVICTYFDHTHAYIVNNASKGN